MKGRLTLVMLTIVLLLPMPIGLLVLTASETGSRWLVQQTLSALPVKISMNNFQGRLLERINITGLHYQSAVATFTVQHLAFAWQATDLLYGRLHIVDVLAEDVQLDIKAADKRPQEHTFDIAKAINLPLEVSLDHFAIKQLTLTSGTQSQQFDKLELVAATQNGQLKIAAVNVQTREATANLQGQIGLGNGYPMQLHSGWQISLADNLNWQGVVEISGDLHKLTVKNRLSVPFILDLQAEVNEATSTPTISVRGTWQNLNWPFVGGQPQLQSSQGTFAISGLLSDYRIAVSSRLSQQYLADADLQLTGTGNLNTFTLKALTLTSKTGAFQLAGKLSWLAEPAFDLTANGQNFNPAILIPELPGNLTFITHVQGTLGTVMAGSAEINQLSGQLRGNPVNASGKLTVQGEDIQVDALRIRSGSNQLAVDGRLGQTQAGLKIDMKLPRLENFWPGLGGSLQGGGQLQGDWVKPTVTFSVLGKALRFAGDSVEKLALDIDVQAGVKKNSTLKLLVNQLKIGSMLLPTVSLNGQGSAAQQQVKAHIVADQGELSAELNGVFKDKVWQGRFSQLDIDSQSLGRWQLRQALAVRGTKAAAGFDLSVANSCLVQQAAEVCLAGDYLANHDFKLAINSKALPLALFKAWLPVDVHSDATINGAASMQQQKGVVSGKYQLTVAASTLAIANKALPLAASSLAGTFKGDHLASEFVIGLSGEDNVQGHLQMAVNKSQTLAGQVSATIAELGLYQPLIAQLTELKGRVQADLALNGSVAKPLLNGHIDVADVRFANRQLMVDHINLRADALGDHLQLQGSVSPKRLQAAADEPWLISSLINVAADLQTQKQGLQGHYNLNTSGQTSLTVDDKSLVLGLVSIAGDINGKQLSAQWHAALLGQDYCRGNLQADTGNNGTLLGQVSASLSQLAMVEFFVPELSAVKGLLTADMVVSGSVRQPQLNGALSLKNGALAVNALGLSVHDINLSAYNAIEQPAHLLIQGAAKSGAGKLKLAGFVDFLTQPEWLVDLLLTGENFEVAKIPEAQIALSPALTIKAIGKQANISGTLSVPKAVLTVQEIPENAVKVSADEVILGAEVLPETPETSAGIDTDVVVELGQEVSFSGQGLTTHLQGRLNVANKAGKMVMNGAVDLNKATYKRFGQDLTVRKGRFLFNGPVDNPWLDIEAIRVSKSKMVTAVLSLSGPLRQPKTKIFSEPALPETEALAYLVTGGPLNQVSQANSDALAGAALSYGAGQASWLANKLGVGELNVEEGETLHDSLLAVGQYLTPDFYVGAKVGLFNKQAMLVLKHNIGKSINVETQTGTSQRIKLNYEFDRD